MSIEEGWSRKAMARGAGRARRLLIGSVALAVVGVSGCTGETGETAVEEAPSGIAEDPAPAAPAAEEPATVAEIFPEGPGRELVLTNCASCHAVACAAIGQRTAGRWDELRVAHQEHVPSLSEEELTTTFAYLSENFSADQPEPVVPPQFLERGCTPF